MAMDENVILELSDGDVDTPEAIRAKVVKILEQISSFQRNIRKHIDDNYIDFMPNHSTFDTYIDEGEQLLRESEHLLSNVCSDARMALSKANLELVQCVDQLREASLGLKVSQRILTISNLFQSIEKTNTTEDYLVVLDLISRLKSLVCGDGDTEVEPIFQKCECYNPIKVKYHIQANILEHNLQQRFENLVQLTEKTFPIANNVALKVSKDVKQLQDTVKALFQVRYNPIKMCDFLWDKCLLPIIMKPVSLETSDKHPDFVQLNISYSLKELTNKSLKPSYKDVFANIRQLFDCLANINVNVFANQYVFTIIGNRIKDRLIDTLINECLMDSIPDTMDEYQQSTLVEDIINFEQSLADMDLINLDCDSGLTEFTTKVKQLFRNRFNDKVLESAREIMQRNLQDTIIVAEGNTSDVINKNPLLFPQCKISKSVFDIIKLMEYILKQANYDRSKSSENADEHKDVDTNENIDIDTDANESEKLKSSIPTILNMYVIEVPKLHKKLLDVIPQQSAIFYNNCMFLAHWVFKNGETGGIPSHRIVVKVLHMAAQQPLKAQILDQQIILTKILKQFDLSDPHTLGMGPLKLIQQCLRQIGLLKNVWLDVLPDSVYNRTLCNLANDFCHDIIKRILNLEDISTTVASELSELIDVILDKVPQFFKEIHEVMQVPCWMKLQQLKMLLNASLHEITEHWCGGVGILTANYKADEIRHLIRALFKNTDRRANALSKIT